MTASQMIVSVAAWAALVGFGAGLMTARGALWLGGWLTRRRRRREASERPLGDLLAMRGRQCGKTTELLHAYQVEVALFEMTDADHEALAAGLGKLQGMVLLSGYRSALYDRLYRDWVRFDVKANADGAVKRTESLWLNAAASERAKGCRQLFEPTA